MNAEAVEKILDEDRSEWESLSALLDAHPEESLHDPASPLWTSRDVYAHIARWTDYSTDQLEARLGDKKPPSLDGTFDEVNIRWQEEDRRLDLSVAQARALQAFERWRRTVRSVPPELWNEELASLAGIDNGKHWHYAMHRSCIIVE